MKSSPLLLAFTLLTLCLPQAWSQSFQFEQWPNLNTATPPATLDLPLLGGAVYAFADFRQRANRANSLNSGSGLAVSGVDDQGVRVLRLYGDRLLAGVHNRRSLELLQELPGVAEGSLAWVDVNNNGWLDLVAFGRSGEGVGRVSAIVFLNEDVEGERRLVASETWSAGLPDWPGADIPGHANARIAVADLDQDGRMDVVFSGPNKFESTRFYLNRGSHFELHEPLSSRFDNYRKAVIAFGDFDKDGLTDFVISARRNYESAVWGPQTNASITLIYRSTGNGGFDFAESLLTPPLVGPGAYRNGAADGDVLWADVDGDGWLDVILMGRNTQLPGNPGVLVVYPNLEEMDNGAIPPQPTGRRVFTEPQRLEPGLVSGRMAVADLDDDGRPELVVAGADTDGNPVFSVYLNEGGTLHYSADASSFYRDLDGEPQSMPFLSAPFVALNPFDALGSKHTLHLLLSGAAPDSSPRAFLFRNPVSPTGSVERPVAHQAVLAPASDIENYPDKVIFSWTPFPSDASKPRSYDIRIGLDAGGRGLSSPASRGASGPAVIPARDLAAPGRTGPHTGYLLREARDLGDPARWLRPGTRLYWDAEAVDGAFRSSGFDIGQEYRVPYFQSEWTGAALNQNVRRGLAFGDFDGDGDLDMAIAGNEGLRVYLNAGSWIGDQPGQMYETGWAAHPQNGTNTAEGEFGIAIGSVEWADMNGDGLLDLVVASSQNGKLAIFYNEGENRDWTFQRVEVDGAADLTFHSGGAIARVADFNHDGRPDILVAGSAGTLLLRNNGADVPGGAASFTAVPDRGGIFNASGSGNSAPAAAWADFDGDGFPDLVLCGNPGGGPQNTQASVYLNRGPDPNNPDNWIFEEAGFSAQLAQVYGGDAAWADLDADGWPDLVLTGRDWNFPGASDSAKIISRIYLNRPAPGGGRHLVASGDVEDYDASAFESTGMLLGTLALGDLNHDGFPDILLTGNQPNNPTTSVFVSRPKDGGGIRLERVDDASSDLPGSSFGSVALADLNFDGRLDVAVAGSGTAERIFTGLFVGDPAPDARHRNSTPPSPPPAESLAAVFDPSTGNLTLSWTVAQDGTGAIPDTPPAALAYQLYLKNETTGEVWIAPGGAIEAEHGRGLPKSVWPLWSTPPGSALGSHTLHSFPARLGDIFTFGVQAIDNHLTGSPFSLKSVCFSTRVTGQVAFNPPPADLLGWEVFWDVNGNGVWDEGEPITTTDAEGNYSLEICQTGSAFLRLIFQEGWGQAGEPLAQIDIADTDAGRQIAEQNFFAEQLSAVTGVVFHDFNNNGIHDPGEPGIADVRVFHDADNNGIWDEPGEPSILTGDDGAFAFVSLSPSAHPAGFRIGCLPPAPAGWRRTSPPQDQPIIAALQHGQSTTQNIGFRLDAMHDNTIYGIVWQDLSGARAEPSVTSGDHPNGLNTRLLGGWTVFMDANGDGVLDEGEIVTVANDYGRYIFESVPLGVHIIRLIPPEGEEMEDWSIFSPEAGFHSVEFTGPDVATLLDVNFGVERAVAGVGFAGGPQREPSGVWQLPVRTAPATHYKLQASGTLAPESWQDVLTFTATGRKTVVKDITAGSASRRFWRVMRCDAGIDKPTLAHARLAAQCVEDFRSNTRSNPDDEPDDEASVRAVARLLTDVNGNPVYETLYRPDVSGAAYFSFAVFPQGFVVVSSGPHDVPVPHYSFEPGTLRERLQDVANEEESPGTVHRIYRLDVSTYAAEDAAGNLISHIGDLPLELKDAALLLTSEFLQTDPEITDSYVEFIKGEPGTGGSEILETLINLPEGDEPPALEWLAFADWQNLKNSYAGAFAPQLAILRNEAEEEWRFEMSLLDQGDGIITARTVALPYAASSVKARGDISSAGSIAWLNTEPIQRQLGDSHAFIVTFHPETPEGTEIVVDVVYENGLEETLRYFAWRPAPPPSEPMAAAQEDEIVMASSSSDTYHVTADGFEVWRAQVPWRTVDYSPPTISESKALYYQFRRGGKAIGCGPVAWGLLWRWVEVNAHATQPNFGGPRGNRWSPYQGVYRANGGQGSNPDVIMPDRLDAGVESVIERMAFHCRTFSVIGSRQSATYPSDMRRARSYLIEGPRSDGDIGFRYSRHLIRRQQYNERARRQIRDTGSHKAVIVGYGNLLNAHYGLAYGYGERWRTSRNGQSVTRSLKINPGYGGRGDDWYQVSLWGTWYFDRVRR